MAPTFPLPIGADVEGMRPGAPLCIMVRGGGPPADDRRGLTGAAVGAAAAGAVDGAVFHAREPRRRRGAPLLITPTAREHAGGSRKEKTIGFVL